MQTKIKSLMVIFLFITIHCDAKEFTVTAQGHVQYFDIFSNKIRPFAGVIVQLWDSDCDGNVHLPASDDLMGTAVTDSQGYYSITGKGGDSGDYSWSKPDVYIKVLYKNHDGRVQLSDELGHAQYAVSAMHSHDDSEGIVNFPPLTVTDGEILQVGKGNKTDIFIGAKKAYDEYTDSVGSYPTYRYEVEYFWGWDAGTPWTTINTTHWPNGYRTGFDSSRYTSFHEFGHSIRHTYDGDETHFLGDNGKFLYTRKHNCNKSYNKGFAFNEAWAIFWSRRIDGTRNPLNMENECDVAHLLREISGALPERRKSMVNILSANPESIHSYMEFCNAAEKMFPGLACDGLGVSMRPLTFVADDFQPLLWKDQVKLIMDAIARQELYAQELKESLAVAKKEADVSLNCPDADCHVFFKKRTRPFLIEANLQVNDMLIKMLREKVKDSTFISTKIMNGSFEKWDRERKLVFRKNLLGILDANLKKSYEAVKGLTGNDVELEELRKELLMELKNISGLKKNNADLPSNLYPHMVGEALLTSEEFKALNRR